MSNKYAKRFGIAVLIMVLSGLVACGGSLSVGEKSSIIIDPTLADTYFSQALGVTPDELANAHQAIREARGITTTTTAFETFENEEAQYWGELLSLDIEKLLEAELETTNRLLMDAVENDLITDDQWKMAVYTNVIDQSTLYPALWAEAVGLSTEEMDDFAQSGIGYGQIAARNNRELVDAFASIYTSHGENMGLDLRMVPWDTEIFRENYSPDEGGCFETTPFSESADQTEISTPFEAVDQISACPILTDSPECNAQTCGHSETGGTGGIGGTGGTGGSAGGYVGGMAVPGGGTGPMDVNVYSDDSIPYLAVGTYTIPQEIRCDDKYGRFAIAGLDQSGNIITFYFDTIPNGRLDPDNEMHNTVTIKTVPHPDPKKKGETINENAYACFTYYTNVKLRYSFKIPEFQHTLDIRNDYDLINQ